MSFPKKHILLALFGLSMFENKLFAQSETETKAEIFTAKNLIFAEFFGNSGGYALNFGRIFFQKEKWKISASAGFSVLYKSEDEPLHPGYLVPAFIPEISAFYGKSKHHLELGVGFNAAYQKSYSFDEDFPNNTKEQTYWSKSIVPRIGYRYQKPEGGFFFRVGYTPSISFESLDKAAKKATFIPFGAGISLGVSF
ncbi:hypothetical protein [Algoriphagus confluentis]|uniref:Outer membrane protein beta-barrel domain-containing protein n=1 Tax=Algoriphagus confluentis TaxID=1697556 RepID=A0ABQ6PIA1_9BACT|nr:hypothetical protein Aconfl_02080 [Algoriphagus confluentis]